MKEEEEERANGRDGETEMELQVRAKSCGQAIREALQKYDCVIHVPQLDISTGRVLPIVQIRAAPLKKESGNGRMGETGKIVQLPATERTPAEIPAAP